MGCEVFIGSFGLLDEERREFSSRRAVIEMALDAFHYLADKIIQSTGMWQVKLNKCIEIYIIERIVEVQTRFISVFVFLDKSNTEEIQLELLLLFLGL